MGLSGARRRRCARARAGSAGAPVRGRASPARAVSRSAASRSTRHRPPSRRDGRPCRVSRGGRHRSEVGTSGLRPRGPPARSASGPVSSITVGSPPRARAGAARDPGERDRGRRGGRLPSAPACACSSASPTDDGPEQARKLAGEAVAPAGHGRRRRRHEPLGGRHRPRGAGGQPVHALRRHRRAAAGRRGSRPPGPSRPSRWWTRWSTSCARSEPRSPPVGSAPTWQVELVNDGPVTSSSRLTTSRRGRLTAAGVVPAGEEQAEHDDGERGQHEGHLAQRGCRSCGPSRSATVPDPHRLLADAGAVEHVAVGVTKAENPVGATCTTHRPGLQRPQP